MKQRLTGIFSLDEDRASRRMEEMRQRTQRQLFRDMILLSGLIGALLLGYLLYFNLLG